MLLKSQRLTAFLLPLLIIAVGVFLGSGNRSDITRAQEVKASPLNQLTPYITAFVNAAESEFEFIIEGPAGESGLFHVGVLDVASGTISSAVVPFVFDANGFYNGSAPLHDIAMLGDFRALFYTSLVGQSGTARSTSATWSLNSKLYAPNDPNALPPGNTVLTQVPMVGTTSPLFPYTQASIQLPLTASSPTSIAYFQCAPTGVEGVIPVN